MPDRARVFYLLGYLRDQQGRKKEAAEHFAKAVEIDPGYINAWSKLGSVADEAGLTVEKKDGILRSDPPDSSPGQNYSYYYSHHNRKVSPRSQLASHQRISQTVRLLESLWRN